MPGWRHTLLLLTLALAACDPVPPLHPEPCHPEHVRHVALFGYYAGAPYLSELSGHSNLSWGAGAGTLSAARAAGLRAVVDVQAVFRIGSASPPPDAEIAAAWAALAEQLRPDLAALAALYPADEPYLNGELNGVAPAEVQRRLETAALLIRSTPGFEATELATIFSDHELKLMEAGKAAMPAGYGWVGWNLYYAPVDRLMEHLDRFLAIMLPGQRLIAVPDAFLWNSRPVLAGLERRIDFWLAWIETHPQVVAVVPFIYQSGPDYLGARDLPSVRARYAQIGSCILTGSQP
jgi:hypothetical protein